MTTDIDRRRYAVSQAAGFVAASKCLLARTFRPVHGLGVNPTATHPEPCAWCDLSVAELAGHIEDFPTDPDNAYAIREFEAMPRDHQSALVIRAQYPAAQA